MNFYFSPRYYVDGLDRDPDYASNSNKTVLNVTNGCLDAPEVVEAGGWAFVWEKQFKLQEVTEGVVELRISSVFHVYFYNFFFKGINFICVSLLCLLGMELRY